MRFISASLHSNEIAPLSYKSRRRRYRSLNVCVRVHSSRAAHKYTAGFFYTNTKISAGGAGNRGELYKCAKLKSWFPLLLLYAFCVFSSAARGSL